MHFCRCDHASACHSYIHARETGLYYLQSRYYNPTIGRFINADNNFSNLNLFSYCGNNPINASDPEGEHWYYLWLDDLFEAVDELMSSVSNIVFGRAASTRALYDPKGAQDLYNSRPFQDIKPSKEMQIFTEAVYDADVVFDVSISISLPKNAYIKTGVSRILSPSKNIQATYTHAGVGVSLSPDLPVSLSYSIGLVRGVNLKEDYAGPFWDVGGSVAYGLDYCYWPSGSSAYSFVISNGPGVYAGFDWYWCID